jgi:hypothetical protein
MDPISILAGTVGLLDVSFRVIGYLRNIEKSAGKVEEETTALSQEIDNIITIVESVDRLWRSNQDAPPGSPYQEKDEAENLWKIVRSLLEECREAALKLEVLLNAVVGKNGAKVTGKFDGIRKYLRRESKEKDYAEVRRRLSSCQAGIRMMLSALGM